MCTYFTCTQMYAHLYALQLYIDADPCTSGMYLWLCNVVHTQIVSNFHIPLPALFFLCFHYRSLIQRRSPMLPTLSPLLLRSVVLIGTSTLLLILRISLLHGQLPGFSDHDNPASFAPHTLTRILTYCYLFFFNARLLVMPATLCYDWQMGSIPLVEGLTDIRNVGTVLFFLYLIGLSLASLCRICSVSFSVCCSQRNSSD